MATREEDEESKKRIQEQLWVWVGRVVVLLVFFGFGWFAGYIMYGAGDTGAVLLRPRVAELEGKYEDQRKKVIDCEGKLVVIQGRMEEVQKALQRTTGGTP